MADEVRRRSAGVLQFDSVCGALLGQDRSWRLRVVVVGARRSVRINSPTNHLIIGLRVAVGVGAAVSLRSDVAAVSVVRSRVVAVVARVRETRGGVARACLAGVMRNWELVG